MINNRTLNRFNSERMDDRQVAEIVGIAHGIIADGKVNQGEAEYLLKWLEARVGLTANPLVGLLRDRVSGMLSDGILDDDEAADLFSTLSAFAGGDFEAGEIAKATTLPLCSPPPVIKHHAATICFTGTFAFGTRKECEAAANRAGALATSLMKDTRYLVIGVYATDSWAQSSFGRKIEKAVEMRAKGARINIVHEPHWISEMQAAGHI